LRGEMKPASVLENLLLAQICLSHKQRFAAAARFYAAALPKLAEDSASESRYNAARAAILACAGQGADAKDLSTAERQALRKQALGWLKAELRARADTLTKDPKVAAALAQTLQHWQSDADLAGVRDPAALAKLPTDEQQAWQQFWADVADLHKRTR